MSTFVRSMFIAQLAMCVALPRFLNEKLSHTKIVSDERRYLRCTNLMRTWGADGSCGECLEGYTSSNFIGNDECSPSDNITVTMDEHIAFIPNGTSVILKCEFPTEEKCSWKRKDSYINANQRYRYLGPGKGSNTKDCSIFIENFGNFDIGDWACRGLSNSNSNGKFGTKVHLYNEVIVTVGNNATAYIPIGEPIVIKCCFKELTNCTWHRNSEWVDINNYEGYSYMGTNKSGLNTHDCSIKIQGVVDKDIGTWKCQSYATSTKDAPLSTIAHLRKINSAEDLPVSPVINFATIGENLSLNCTFQQALGCKWTRNGTKIDATSGFGYNKGTSSNDCSITIQSIEEKDFGEWTCSCEDCMNTGQQETSWLIKKRDQPYPKIFLSKQKGQEANILCIMTGGGMTVPVLHWQLDGKDIQSTNREVRNTDNSLSGVMISMNITEQLMNAKLLRCVAKLMQEEWSDQIQIVDVQYFMKDEQEGSSNVTMSTELMIALIAIISIAVLVAWATCLYKCYTRNFSQICPGNLEDEKVNHEIDDKCTEPLNSNEDASK